MQEAKSNATLTAFLRAIRVSCYLLHLRAAQNSYVTNHGTLATCDPIRKSECLGRTTCARCGGWVKNEKGQIEERKLELQNPELEQRIEDVGDGLNGCHFVDE